MNTLKSLLKFLVLISLFLSYPVIAAKWTWRNPLPQGDLLSSVNCSTENLCVAVRYSGTVLTSIDTGINWIQQSAGTNSWLYGISCPTETLCVAVGYAGTVLTSTDGGINWTVQSAGTINHLFGISCSTENRCVAVGDYGTVLISTDGGVNWTLRSAGTSNLLSGISCPADNLCVAVGGSGTVLTSTDGGINWTVQSTGTNNGLYGISCPTANLCVAVGHAGTVLTSTNGGINWTIQSAGTSNGLNGISCPTETLCVAVGDHNTVLISTDRGTNWAVQSAGTSNWMDINCPTENFCIAVTYGDTVLTSTDGGINWIVQPLGINNAINGISCLNNRCIIVGSGGNILTTDNTQPLVEADIKPISGKIGDTFALNLADYFEDSENGNNLTYTILGNYTVVQFEQSQLPQLNLTLVTEGSEDVTLRVTDRQGLSIEYAFKVSVENVSAACEPASYSNQTHQAYLPALEIHFFTKIGGKAINMVGLYSAILEISFDFPNFEVKEITFIKTMTDSNPCDAVFMPDTGILTIPTLEVTAELIEGPVLTCSATLQQSVLKPEVLSLIRYACDLPS